MTARTTTIRQLSGDAVFRDWDSVSTWARDYVYTAFRTGWMRGDPSGEFRPRADIRRAEVATAVNRTLGRVDSWYALAALYLRNPYAVRDFPDMTDTGWYFPSVLAAANDHRVGHGWKEIVP